jgi:hypothetical protein
MTEEQIALARRAVACKGWRWMPGMLHGTVAGGELRVCYRMGDLTLYLDADRVPDLTDPATLGCLLALVREAHEDECACVFPIDYGPGGVRWVARLTAGGRDMTQQVHVSEAEALVAALEATP